MPNAFSQSNLLLLSMPTSRWQYPGNSSTLRRHLDESGLTKLLAVEAVGGSWLHIIISIISSVMSKLNVTRLTQLLLSIAGIYCIYFAISLTAEAVYFCLTQNQARLPQ